MTQEELETMSNKIAEVAPDQLPVFLNNPDAFDYNVLEGYSDFTDKYKNVAEFIGDKSAIKAQIWKDLNGKFPSDARFQTLKDKYTWLNKEDLKKWFDKTNEYKKFYEDEARKEGEKNRRAKEVAGTYVNLANPEEADERNWGLFRNILTSDYEKQRYINEPETALFGYDAPELGKAPVTRSAAIGDLAAGTAATAADFVPSAWWLGPTIRMGRDLAYNISDSKYAKSKEDIAASIAADYGINATAKFLPNWRKGERVAAKASDPTVAKTLATVEAEANYKNSLNSVSNILETGKPNDIIKTIDALPEGEVKSRLIQYAQPGKPVNKQKIREEMGATYSVSTQGELSKETQEFILQTVLPIKPETKDQVLECLNGTVENLGKNGIEAKYFDKVKEYLQKTYQENQRENSYWSSIIKMNANGQFTIIRE